MNRTSRLTTVRAALATVGLLGVAAAPAVASALALRVGLRAWDGPIRLLGPDDLAVIAGAIAALAASLWLFAAVVAALPEAWRSARAAARGARPLGPGNAAGSSAWRAGAVRRLVIVVITVAAIGAGTTAASTPGAVAASPVAGAPVAAAQVAAAQAQVPLGWALTGQGADSPSLGWQPTATGHTDQASSQTARQAEVQVRPGDSLWTIAAAHLPQGATAAQIRHACTQWYAANRDRIGDDPNLLHPGTLLRPPR